MNELYEKMLAVAFEEARHGLVEGGIPIGAAMFTRTGELVSRGTIAVCNRAIPACTLRRMPFAGPAANAAIATW